MKKGTKKKKKTAGVHAKKGKKQKITTIKKKTQRKTGFFRATFQVGPGKQGLKSRSLQPRR